MPVPAAGWRVPWGEWKQVTPQLEGCGVASSLGSGVGLSLWALLCSRGSGWCAGVSVL